MASMVTTLGNWRWLRRRRAAPAHQTEPAAQYSLEDAAELAPGWGALELRGARGKHAGNMTPDWRWEVDRLRIGR